MYSLAFAAHTSSPPWAARLPRLHATTPSSPRPTSSTSRPPPCSPP